MVDHQPSARLHLLEQFAHREFGIGRVLNHSKADHHVEQARPKRSAADVALDDPVAVILRKIDLVGLDGGTEIRGSEPHGGITQQNFGESARAATRLKNLDFFPARHCLDQFTTEAAVQAIGRDGRARVRIKLRQPPAFPLLAEGVGVVGVIGNYLWYIVCNFKFIPIPCL